MGNQSGYVYLLKNEAMPGIYKIGMTNRTVEERVKELSLSTSIPLPFEVVCSVKVDDPMELESEFHEEYEDFRIASNREFFRLDNEELDRVKLSFACHSLSKIDDIEEEYSNIFAEDMVGKLIDISVNVLDQEAFYFEGEYIKGSELMALLKLCFRRHNHVYIPIALHKLCTIDEYKNMLKDNIEPRHLKQCVDSMDNNKSTIFELKELLEE